MVFRIMVLCLGLLIQVSHGKATGKLSLPPLEVAAVTFSIQPRVGTLAAASHKPGIGVEAVYGDLKTTLTFFRQGNSRFLLVTSALNVDGLLRDPVVAMTQAQLSLSDRQIVTASSHSHTIPILLVDVEARYSAGSAEYLSWELGMEFRSRFREAVSKLESKLVAVDVYWAKAEENRISYNRRGRYPDGTTYFMREEDRLLVGEGYVGLIDPDATLVLFKESAGGAPVSALTMFAAHPVAAYNPERPISFGQFPQLASDSVSAYFGGIPVGFMQGTAGDINCKYMLTGTIDQAFMLGEQLAATFMVAAKSLRPSKRIGMDWNIETAYIPLNRLPSLAELENSLEEIEDFIIRGNAGDENTLRCVGMNFPKALTPPFRAKLVALVRDWYVWGIEQYQNDRLAELPTRLPMKVFVARFGDVGFVGLPYEAFVKTGLKIKTETPLPIVMVAGYTNGTYGYIPDASAVDEREYMAGFFRYVGSLYKEIGFIPPYKGPAGDEAAAVAVKALTRFAN